MTPTSKVREIFASNLRRLLAESGKKQADLAKYLGITNASVNDWVRGKKMPRIDKIDKICAFFVVNRSALMGSPGEPEKNSHAFDVTQLKNYAGKAEKFLRVPVIGTVKCGPNGFAYQYLEDVETIPDDGSHSDIVAFRCSGDSMSGLGIFDGDIAFVHLQPEVDSGDLAVVVVDGEEGMLKRVVVKPGLLLLESANASYPTRVFAGEETNIVRIVGRVLWVKKVF